MSHNVKVGEVFYSSWGYDQTNIDFYEVVKVTPKTVGIRGLKSVATAEGHMHGTCVPAKGEDRWLQDNDVLKRGTVLTRTVRISPYDGEPRFNAHSDYASCQRWKGNPLNWSSWA